MSYEELTIKQLSKSGEVVKSVSCYKGQVSVFRSTSEFELKNFGMALLGMPGSNKFEVGLDGYAFAASEHVFVGFGERQAAGELTVRGYLSECGVAKNQIDQASKKVGIEDALDQRLDTLDAVRVRIVRLLAAAFSTGDSVIVLNDPFAPLSVDQREFFAKAFCECAQARDAIVVVTDLSSRPDCWIENPLIIRIDLSKRQPTIGFGSQDLDMQTLVKRVQEAVRAEPSRTDDQDAPATQRKRTYMWGGMLALIVLIMGLNWIVLKREIDHRIANVKQDPTQIVSATEMVAPALPTESTPVALHHAQGEQQEKPGSQDVTVVPGPVPAAATSSAKFVLSSYSPAIQKSIKDAFVGVVDTSSSNSEQSALLLSGGENDQNRKRSHSSQPSELLTMLEAASSKDDQKSGAGQSAVQQQQPESSNVQGSDAPQVVDWEAEREAMRQRFLQAIEESGQE